MLKRRGLVCLLSFAAISCSLGLAATQNRIASGLTAATVPLNGQIHRLAQPQFDQGPVDPGMQMGTITLLTTPTAAQQQALTLLLAQQQDRKSPNFHKWLTPEQYADRFGLSRSDIAQIVTWLQGQGFTNVHPARGRNWVSFTGSASQVQTAFATEIHRYNINGEIHYANATEPMLPAALSGIATGFRGLHDFHPRPRAKVRARPNWVSSKYGDFVAPGDLATIYGIQALYDAGIDGTGQKLAVMGQTAVYLADLNDFRTGFGLPTISPTNCTTDSNGLIITPCNDPHFMYLLDGAQPAVKQGDLGEADLDLEWSAAVARGAQIIFVNSNDTFTSYYYAIDNNVAPVISLSYGFCELDDNILSQDETELQKANTEGITFVNSSGDSGAAECDFFQTLTTTNLATQGIAVSYPASSAEVTGVGGTAVTLAAWNSSTYWNSSNGTNGGTAKSYVPEQVWNDDLQFFQYCQQNPTNLFCTQGGSTAQPGWVSITSETAAQNDIGLSSSGGGASNCTVHTGTSANPICVSGSGFAKPSWQTVTISGQTTRMSPDVSFLGTPNFPGYVFCTPLSELTSSNSTASSCAAPGGIQGAVDTYLSIIGGTSASAPVFAGVVTLMNQYLGGSSSTGLGNVNPTLYQLALTPSNGAFHPVTSGDNNVACQVGTPSNQPTAFQCQAGGVFGFSASNSDATTGYNMVAGLGSINVNNLAIAWAASRTSTTTSLTPSSTTPFLGESLTLTATVTPSTATGTVTFNSGATVLGTSPLAAGTAMLATSSLPLGTDTITATYSGSGTLNTSTSSGSTVTVAPAFSMTADAASFQVAQGSNVDATVTVTLTTGFTGPITFSCTDQVAGSICTPPGNINASQDVSFHITTSLPTARLERPLDRGSRILYAALLPGLFGLVFIAGSRKRSTGAMRVLGLIAVLGASTLWMASCGGSSSGSGGTTNPGTPKGTYTITATGTSGSTTNTATFQLVVQ
jgi:subtilase family serine protease